MSPPCDSSYKGTHTPVEGAVQVKNTQAEDTRARVQPCARPAKY